MRYYTSVAKKYKEGIAGLIYQPESDSGYFYRSNKWIKLWIAEVLMVMVLAIFSCDLSALHKKPKDKIIIEGFLSSDIFNQQNDNDLLKNVLKMKYSQLRYIEPSVPLQSIDGDFINGKVNWTLYSSDQLLIFPLNSLALMVAPGDSIYVNYEDSIPVFSGKDSEKCNLQNELNRIDKNLKRPTSNSITIDSLGDFLRWNKYVDTRLALQLPLLDSYKHKLQPDVYDYYKTAIISTAENYRVNAFGALRNLYQEKVIPFPSSDLEALWDSTQYKSGSNWLRSLSTYNGSIQNMFGFVRLEVWRKFGFNFKNDSLNIKEIRTSLYYSNVKQRYNGLLRERLLAFIIGDQAIKEMGLRSHTTKTLLKDYYIQPGYPECKKWVKNLEKNEKYNY
jgi:hypothetical protein